MYQGFILHGQNGIKFRSTYKKYNWGFETIECETEPGSTDIVSWYISKTHAIDQSKEVNICMWGKLICSVHTDPSHQLLKLAVKFTVVPNIYLYIQQWLTIRPLPPHKTLLQFFFFYYPRSTPLWFKSELPFVFLFSGSSQTFWTHKPLPAKATFLSNT